MLEGRANEVVDLLLYTVTTRPVHFDHSFDDRRYVLLLQELDVVLEELGIESNQVLLIEAVVGGACPFGDHFVYEVFHSD